MIPNMDGRHRAARAVAARRGELGLTQQELADAAGVDSKTIYNLESKVRWPIARTRSAIEKALDWPAGELQRIEDEAEPEPDPVPPRVYEAVRDGIAPKYQEAVIEAIRGALTGRREKAS